MAVATNGRRLARAVRSAMALLITDTACASELASNGGIGALGLVMTEASLVFLVDEGLKRGRKK